MKVKGIVVFLSVLAFVVSLPILTHAANKNYDRIWSAADDPPIVWNIYQGQDPVEWMTWRNNYRFSYVRVVWYGNDNNMDLVLDSATGLVWQRRPLNTTANWVDAQVSCATLMAGPGYLMGWRLPHLQELTSLVEYSYSGGALPTGHPFIIGTGFKFWSATPHPGYAAKAFYVDFFNSSNPVQIERKDVLLNVWCVRGGAIPVPSASGGY